MAAGDAVNSVGTVKVTAPTGGYTKGLIYQVSGGGYMVARETKSAGEECLMQFQGAVEVTKATDTGETFEVGDTIGVDSAGKASAETDTGTVKIHAIAVEAVSSASTTTVKIFLGAAGIADD